MINLINKKKLYNDQGYIELWDFSKAHQTEETAIEAISKVASICYGKEPINKEMLYNKLKAESLGLPSSSFEFIRNPLNTNILYSLRHDNSFLNQKELKNIEASNVYTFKIKIPIFIARQLVRHRQAAYQELSRRYTTGKSVNFSFFLPNWTSSLMKKYNNLLLDAEELYYELLKENIKPEQARMVLPVSLFTEMWIQMEDRHFKDFLKLRTAKKAQKEMQDLAKTMEGMVYDFST